jgi:hypothetical protein
LYNSHRQLLRYEKDGPEELYCFAQNNNILKNNLCVKNASPRAEVNPKFSDQLIGALIGVKFFFLKISHVGYQKIRLFA